MSASSVSLNTDVHVRYDRLKNEYIKLRSQAKVLQEGVKSEREASEKLKAELKTVERDVRKLRSENESLTFRNEQLTRRVESLQAEVEQKGMSKDKKKPKDAPSRDVVEQLNVMNGRVLVLEEELAMKLKQNEQLTSKVTELERIHSEELSELSSKFRKELAALQKKVEENQNQKRDDGSTLLETIVEKPSPVVARPIESVRPLRVHSGQGDAGQAVGEREVQPSPCLPSCQTPEVSDASQQIAESCRAVLQGASSLFLLLSQRSEIYPFDASLEPLPPQVKKLSSAFSQCCQLVTSLITIVDDCVDRGEIEWPADAIRMRCSMSLLAQHCTTILPPLIENMAQEESKVTWSNGALESLNMEWSSLLQSIMTSFQSISNGLEEENADGLTRALKEMVAKIRALCQCFVVRWQLESRFPSTSRRLICVAEAMRDCLQQLAVDSEKLVARLHAVRVLKESSPEPSTHKNNNNCIPSAGSNGYSVNGDSEMEEETQEGREKEEGETEGEEKENVFLKTEIVPPSECAKCVERESLSEDRSSQELSHLKSRICDLENERERNLVDLALLRRKVSNLGGGKNGVEIGTPDSEAKSENEHVREFTRGRLRALLNDRQEAETRGRYFRGECAILVRKMRVSQIEKETLQSKIKQLEKENEELADELSSVRNGYETQLSSLTEHVADLNSRLMGLEEERQKRREQPPSPATSARGFKSLFSK